MHKLSKWLTRTDEPSKTFKKSINNVLTSFRHIASTPETNSAFFQITARVAPVEFVFIGEFLGKLIIIINMLMAKQVCYCT